MDGRTRGWMDGQMDAPIARSPLQLMVTSWAEFRAPIACQLKLRLSINCHFSHIGSVSVSSCNHATISAITQSLFCVVLELTGP